jgi:hypothetical protein
MSKMSLSDDTGPYFARPQPLGFKGRAAAEARAHLFVPV